MPRSGDHRIRHLARWVATPTLALAAGLVVFAAYDGRPTVLTGAAVAAVVAGIVAVAVFDVELIRSRRAHGADRVAQARSYAAMYAAHVRVMAEGFALADSRRRHAVAPVVDDPAYGRTIAAAAATPVASAVTADVEPSVGAVAGVEIAAPVAVEAKHEPAAKLEPAVKVDPVAKPEPAVQLEPAAKGDEAADVDAARTAAVARSVEPQEPAEAGAVAQLGDGRTPEQQVRESAQVDNPVHGKEIAPVAVPVAASDGEAAVDASGPGGAADGIEMWENVRDAPTVVDLMAWEVRARIAAEDERERQAEVAVAEADVVAQAERAKVARTRKTRRRRGA